MRSVLVIGTTDNQKSVVESHFALIKKILDSAKFLDPNDRSPEARKQRSPEWRQFDGLRFLAEIGIEEGRDGYADKNIVAKAITRDQPAWGQRPPIDQVVVVYPAAGSAAPSAPAKPASIDRPSWAS
jgi:hypothetical protein